MRLAVEADVTRQAAVARIAERLAAAGIEDASREALLLVRRGARLGSAAMIADPDAPLGEAAARVEMFAARRERGEPLSRIEGRREFWGLDLVVTPDVLDPRADTETLVEAALSALSVRREQPLQVLDLGVGSGAILAALLSEWPRATGLGLDASAAAVDVARHNLARFGARARVEVGDWGRPAPSSWPDLSGPSPSRRERPFRDEPGPSLAAGRAFDVIVSNPPYIRSADIAGLDREVSAHDPAMALDGGVDGLDAYRALAPDIARLLASEGRFFVEIGAGQGEDVTAIFVAAGLTVCERRLDLGGVERVLAGLRAGEFVGQ